MRGMKAIRYERYGAPEVLRLKDTGDPAVGDEDVLIRVLAASVNPLDWHFMRGIPYILRPQTGLLRPKDGVLGADMAGRVEEVGKHVTAFAPGDEVFGCLAGLGTFAEYISVHEDAVVLPKPANQTFAQAASVPLAAFTALQALRDQGHIQPGHKVLVNGAAGGVGTFTVQIARALGAEVTGVCGTGNTEMVASIGASQVIDYTRQDVLRDLLLAGKISPVIDRTYPFNEVPEAIRYLEQGHARGKVVITVLRRLTVRGGTVRVRSGRLPCIRRRRSRLNRS